MMIWRYVLPVEKGPFTLEMPKGARALSVGRKGGRPCLWASIPIPRTPPQPRKFFLGYTGEPLLEEKEMKFVGTVSVEGAGLVFHYFEIVRRNK